jgi:hypothetical protein
MPYLRTALRGRDRKVDSVGELLCFDEILVIFVTLREFDAAPCDHLQASGASQAALHMMLREEW